MAASNSAGGIGVTTDFLRDQLGCVASDPDADRPEYDDGAAPGLTGSGMLTFLGESADMDGGDAV